MKRVSRLRLSAVLVATLLVGGASQAPAEAAPGDLDATFSGDGKQTTDLRLGFSMANATAIQPDGKIIAVGQDFAHGGGGAIARYNPDGSLDTSFSGDGRLTSPVADTAAVAVQGDGKIVVAGGLTLSRYNADGTLDPTFSGDGNQTIVGFPFASGVAIQDDGKIVVVGGTGGEGRAKDFAIARYNPNGSLDTSFSGDGKQRTDLGGADAADAVALQDDGKVVAAGSYGGSGRFALARYNPNGALDPSFSGDGKSVIAYGRGGARGVALQDDGKIVVAGGSGGLRDAQDFALARFTTAGLLDSSFSHDGKQTTDLEDVDAATGVAVQADGRIVAVGRADVLSVDHPDSVVTGDFGLARYNTDGSLDTSFSGNGKQTTDFFGGFDSAAGVALQDDAGIVAVGAVRNGGGQDFGLARYQPDGSLDPGFSADGEQTTNFGGVDDRANALAIQDDGKIVAVGGAGFQSDFALTRYHPDGTLDPTFSGDGRQTTDFGGFDSANALAIQDDGKIVVVGQGSAIFVGEGFAIARYNADGSLDTSFSDDGMQMSTLAGDAAYGVAIQPDGKIVVAGSYSTTGLAVARFNSDGSPDMSFSGDGFQETAAEGFVQATGVALQDDGKIVVAGFRYAGTVGEYDFALARYNPGGGLATAFAGDGIQTTDFGGDDRAAGVALQPNGKIVAVGQADGSGSQDFALARYNPDGSRDTSFSGDGKQTTSFGGIDGARGIALQPNGKIVAAGFGGATGFDFALARFNPGGSLDTAFSGDGRRRTAFGNTGPSRPGGAGGVALQDDGKIVTAGVGRVLGQTQDFALVRYLGN